MAFRGKNRLSLKPRPNHPFKLHVWWSIFRLGPGTIVVFEEVFTLRIPAYLEALDPRRHHRQSISSLLEDQHQIRLTFSISMADTSESIYRFQTILALGSNRATQKRQNQGSQRQDCTHAPRDDGNRNPLQPSFFWDRGYLILLLGFYILFLFMCLFEYFCKQAVLEVTSGLLSISHGHILAFN
ncbi:hypothetical protein FKM82_012588 [Ascaphus truei]